jgi:hypothetical protein
MSKLPVSMVTGFSLGATGLERPPLAYALD